MKSRIHKARIEYHGFVQDPMSDSAVRLDFRILGPSDYIESFNVYFSDRFIELYFKIPWNRKLDEEESRLIHEKNRLFLKWGLAKLESFLRQEIRETKVVLDFDADGDWARKVESGEITPVSREVSENLFDYAD